LSAKKTAKARIPLLPKQPNEWRIETSTRIANEILGFPAYVAELNRLLSNTPVDLKQVGEVIRTEPNLSSHILHLCKLTMPCFGDQIASIEHGVVSLGIDQMRTLILACCLVRDLGNCYSADQLRSFWQHSVLTASLSERIARYMNYPRAENAYRAGLFHDAGALALVRWAARTRTANELGNSLCGEMIEAERDTLGIDHCFVGNLIGQAWGLPAEIVDVLKCHHYPLEAQCDRVLVGMVAAADSFCVERGIRFQLVKEPASESARALFPQSLSQWLPDLGSDLDKKLRDVLEMTYLQKVNDFDSGYGSVFGRPLVRT